MPYVMGRFKVANYDRWKKGFEAGAAIRKANGARSAMAFRSAADPQEVVLIIDWEDVEIGRRTGQLPEILELQKASGVISPFEPYIEADSFES